MAQGVAIPEPSSVLQRAHHGHMGMTMTTDSLSYPNIVVEHLSHHRIAGLRFLLNYALAHQHARGWIAPLTLLLQRSRLGREVRGG
jgi:hypothetical protein